MMTYNFIAKSLEFQNPMVNDHNQHLCGDWFMDGIIYDNESLFQRVAEKKKPSIVFYQKSLEMVTIYENIALRLGLGVHVLARKGDFNDFRIAIF